MRKGRATMPFEPEKHLMKIKRREKLRDGSFKMTEHDYLEVKWRLVMFREQYPHGSITTEEVCVDLERGYARYKATACDGKGGVGTGYGTETQTDFSDYCERAETRALGRALAVLGFGTQFVGQDLTEGPHVADTPGRMPERVAGGAGPGGPPDPEPEHPTPDQINGLIELAEAAGYDLRTFGNQVREYLQLPEDMKMTRQFLCETLTLEQYDHFWVGYQQQLAQLTNAGYANPPEVNVPEVPPSQTAASSQEDQTTTAEGTEASTAVRLTTPLTDRVNGEAVATPLEIVRLKELARSVGHDGEGDAAGDVQDALEYHPEGLPMDIYETMIKKLTARQANQLKAARTK